MEQVLVISRSLFDALGSFQGFQPDVDRYLKSILAQGANHFMDRPAAEADPTHKQIIPYSIFRYSDCYLNYQRGSSSGEKRLVAKRSMGIGGHINPIDQSQDGMGETMYLNSIEREIAEELVLKGTFTQKVVGLINDDTSDVGRVHLGVVHLFELSADEVRSNEEAIQDVRFSTLPDLQDKFDQLESWSQICLRHLISCFGG